MIPADSTRRTLLQGLVAALGGDQAGWLAWLGRRARAVAAGLGPSPAESATSPLSASDVEAELGTGVWGCVTSKPSSSPCASSAGRATRRFLLEIDPEELLTDTEMIRELARMPRTAGGQGN